MKRKVQLPIILNTVLVVLYVFLHLADAPTPAMMTVFVLWPVFFLWTAYAIIRWDRYQGRELGEDEEWGYEDRRQFYK